MKALTLTLAAAAVAAAAFAGSSATASSALPQRVLLADYSLDTTAGQRAEAIRDVGQMADLAASERGLIAAAPFQASALATINWPVFHRFNPKRSDPNSYYTRIDLQQQADAVKAQARKLFGHQRAVQGTDLLGGLIAAGELFSSQPNGPRTLVITSNMWLYSRSDGLMLKQRPLTLPQITAAISKLSKAQKVARLRGVCVYVIGGGLDPRRQIPNSTQVSLRAFWKAYFARAGATLRAWTPTLDAEPSC